ncbi:MAG: hypothetical protein RLZZ385_2414 [Pseudomonadota bacterium]|jgi:secreted trypsin-like serine protease
MEFKSLRHFKKGLLALLLWLAAMPTAFAIITRHDRSSDAYRVQASEYPAVFYLERQGARKVCVATLIDPQWAITAAHCLAQTSMPARLEAGDDFMVEVAGVERGIQQAVIHPDYSSTQGPDVDLALLRFSEALPYPRPLPLYRQSDELHQVVTLLGWGYTGIGTTGRQRDDGDLRRAHNRISQVDHQLLFRFDDPREPASDALEFEGMPGLGDSGGPALLVQADGSWLLGVAVGELMGADFDEETQGSYGAQAVYERISRHQEWIDGVIGGR